MEVKPRKEVAPGRGGKARLLLAGLRNSNIVQPLRNTAIKEISSCKACQKAVIRSNPLAETHTTNSVSNPKNSHCLPIPFNHYTL